MIVFTTPLTIKVIHSWIQVAFFRFRGAAKNTFYLKKIRVTHVLNAAEGNGPGYVDTDQNFYRVFGIKYKGLKLLDAVHTNIAMYFNGAANYIDDALKQGGKRVVLEYIIYLDPEIEW